MTDDERALLVQLKEQNRTIFKSIEDQKEALEKLVTRPEFKPVQMLVYGATALMLSAVFGALITLVIKGST